MTTINMNIVCGAGQPWPRARCCYCCDTTKEHMYLHYGGRCGRPGHWPGTASQRLARLGPARASGHARHSSGPSATCHGRATRADPPHSTPREERDKDLYDRRYVFLTRAESRRPFLVAGTRVKSGGGAPPRGASSMKEHLSPNSNTTLPPRGGAGREAAVGFSGRIGSAEAPQHNSYKFYVFKTLELVRHAYIREICNFDAGGLYFYLISYA